MPHLWDVKSICFPSHNPVFSSEVFNERDAQKASQNKKKRDLYLKNTSNSPFQILTGSLSLKVFPLPISANCHLKLIKTLASGIKGWCFKLGQIPWKSQLPSTQGSRRPGKVSSRRAEGEDRPIPPLHVHLEPRHAPLSFPPSRSRRNPEFFVGCWALLLPSSSLKRRFGS